MYNPKDIQFVGKYDYDKEKALKFASYDVETFSINIFQWELKSNKKSMKAGKGVVRVIGEPRKKEQAFKMAEDIVVALDNGHWNGPKTVKIK